MLVPKELQDEADKAAERVGLAWRDHLKDYDYVIVGHEDGSWHSEVRNLVTGEVEILGRANV